MSIGATVGANVQRLRRERSISAEDFAGRMGVSITTLSRLENGHRGIKVEDMVALARALGVSPLALLEGESQDFLNWWAGSDGHHPPYVRDLITTVRTLSTRWVER